MTVTVEHKGTFTADARWRATPRVRLRHFRRNTPQYAATYRITSRKLMPNSAVLPTRLNCFVAARRAVWTGLNIQDARQGARHRVVV